MNFIKGDKVLVTTGRSKGSQGTVEKVIPALNKLVVAGANIYKRHIKPSQKNPRGGIIEMPTPMNASNVAVVCPHCSKPTRIGHTVGADNKKYRYCKKCQASLDSR